VLRIYSGSACALIDGSNNYTCSWSNANQAFSGCGCVPDPSLSTQCACRHLTEFASSSSPSIPTVSLSDMLALNPADILTKLRMFFIVIITLFGAMNLGAAVGWWQDVHERRSLVQQFMTPEAGFRVTDAGARVWSFSLVPRTAAEKTSGLQTAPEGPAVTLSSIMGIPFSRLRVVIPDAAVSWPIGEALGRKAALSAGEIADAFEKEKAGVQVDDSGLTKLATFNAREDDEFWGTAIVLAFLQAESIMERSELTEMIQAARRHFHGTQTSSGRTFSQILSFWLIAFDDNLNKESGWLPFARLARLYLSQTAEGYWEPGPDVAFGTLARQQKEVAALKHGLKARLRRLATLALSCCSDAGGANDEELDESGELTAARGGGMAEEDWEQLSSEVDDCPLACSVLALHQTIPLALQALPAEVGQARVWATLTALSVLQRLRVSLLSPELDGESWYAREITLVDNAHGWLAQQSERHPQLRDALEGGCGSQLRARADFVTLRWVDAWSTRISHNRRLEALTARMARYHAERAGAKLARAIAVRHPTASAFLASAGKARRWQVFMSVVTLVISTLFVQVWMFWTKGLNCCTDVRSLINADGGACPPDPNGVGVACRGFTGTCGDIPTQFADTPVLPHFPTGLWEYTCTAFPDESRPVDAFIVGLLSIAIALPCSYFIATMFELSTDNDAPRAVLRWPFSWPALLYGLQGNRRWHYTGEKGQPAHLVRWWCRYRYVDPHPAILADVLLGRWARLTGLPAPWVREAEAEAEKEEKAAHHVEEDEEEMAEARENTRFKRYMMLAGFGSCYLIWALFTWIIFTIGIKVYHLMGEGVEAYFAKSFGISYGMGQASEWLDVTKEALKAAFVMAVLERLFLSPNRSWLEEHCDYLSVQAVLLRSKSSSLFTHIRHHFHFTRRFPSSE